MSASFNQTVEPRLRSQSPWSPGPPCPSRGRALDRPSQRPGWAPGTAVRGRAQASTGRRTRAQPPHLQGPHRRRAWNSMLPTPPGGLGSHGASAARRRFWGPFSPADRPPGPPPKSLAGLTASTRVSKAGVSSGAPGGFRAWRCGRGFGPSRGSNSRAGVCLPREETARQRKGARERTRFQRWGRSMAAGRGGSRPLTGELVRTDPVQLPPPLLHPVTPQPRRSGHLVPVALGRTPHPSPLLPGGESPQLHVAAAEQGPPGPHWTQDTSQESTPFPHWCEWPTV